MLTNLCLSTYTDPAHMNYYNGPQYSPLNPSDSSSVQTGFEEQTSVSAQVDKESPRNDIKKRVLFCSLNDL